MSDCIKREDAKRELCEWATNLHDPRFLIKDDAMCVLDNIPAAEVEVIHEPTESEFKRMAIQKGYVQVAPARWLDGRCTRCGWEEPDEVEYDYETEPWEETPFCPMCGARMGGGDNNA